MTSPSTTASLGCVPGPAEVPSRYGGTANRSSRLTATRGAQTQVTGVVRPGHGPGGGRPTVGSSGTVTSITAGADTCASASTLARAVELGRQLDGRAEHGADAAARGPTSPRPGRRRRPASTRPASEAGSAARHGQRGPRRAGRARCRDGPAVTGAASTSPAGAPACQARTRPERSTTATPPAGPGHRAERDPLGHDDRHAVGPVPDHHGVRHPGQRSTSGGGALRVDVDERRVRRAARRLRARPRRPVCCGAAHRGVRSASSGVCSTSNATHSATSTATPPRSSAAGDGPAREHRHPALPHPGMHDRARSPPAAPSPASPPAPASASAIAGASVRGRLDRALAVGDSGRVRTVGPRVGASPPAPASSAGRTRLELDRPRWRGPSRLSTSSRGRG